MSERPLATLAVPPRILEKLIRAGFTTSKDVIPYQCRAHELASEAGILVSAAQQVISLACESEPAEFSQVNQSQLQSQSIGSSVLELLNRGTQSKIITMSQALDGMLGGGITIGEVTEFLGSPGIGKTQIAMQLAINVQIPKFLQGVEGDALFIDTEGSFSATRIHQMATKISSQLKVLAERTSPQNIPLVPDPRSILSHIHVFRVFDQTEQLALIRSLPSTISDIEKSHGRSVRLVIFDSIAFHFRYNTDDMAARTRSLNIMSQTLTSLAKGSNIAVVLLNQVTTRVVETTGESHVVPALGEGWAHASTNRVILFTKDSLRRAHLAKSPCLRPATITFEITSSGVRDCREVEKRKRSPSPSPSPSPAPASPAPS
eukprot:c1676_g1_i1.p1 GENE.c1676_g1_i1~~c1676_g1_i1.p1  ORF type:complete len:375 (+),score=80.57 c1676_g1_i1:23-1147(+)